MTPIEALKTGIVNGDWSAVCCAYKMLTGEVLLPLVKEGIKDPVLDEIIAFVQSFKGSRSTASDVVLIEKADAIPSDPVDQEPTGDLVASGKGKSAYGDITLVSQDVVDPNEVKRNLSIAKVSASRKKKRPPPTTHQVSCWMCKKNFTVDEAPDPERFYKCPACIRAAIGR